MASGLSRPSSDDLDRVRILCFNALRDADDESWHRPALGTWTCRQVLEHLAGLAFAPQLATRSWTFAPLALIVDQTAPTSRLIDTADVMTKILVEVARSAPDEARAFHPWGTADRSGWIAMAMDEILVHTNDILAACAREFVPLAGDCRMVLDRLFPWWPAGEDPFAALLWANGRRALGPLPRPPESWQWHSRPLTEWDGVVPAAYRDVERGRG